MKEYLDSIVQEDDSPRNECSDLSGRADSSRHQVKCTKVLVAIANHGTKNSRFLERLIAEYRGMSKYAADIVVLSNVEKDCGPDVEVIVGVPHKNPWSLPFAHKKVFVERAQQYDLFIYSEDDTLITENNIDAFLRATELLPRDHIAGFIRYELAPDGARTYTTMHGRYHWDCNSVLRVGDHTFAYYTNEHSACYILTREQLRRAIASGGFLLPPREGRYDMLVTAATDPYTQCGMRKLVCISHLEDFSLHHLPNVYWDRKGLPAAVVEREIQELLADAARNGSNGPIFRAEALLPDTEWDRRYYEPCKENIVSAVPDGTKSLLSVGCGCGCTEAALKEKGIDVTAIPIDRIVGITAAAKGVRVLPPSLEVAFEEVKGREFDCVLLHDVLCRVPEPQQLLQHVADLLSSSGRIVITSRNGGLFWQLRSKYLPQLFMAMQNPNDSFARLRFRFGGLGTMKTWFAKAGLRIERVKCQPPRKLKLFCRITFGALDRFVSRDHLVICSRCIS